MGRANKITIDPGISGSGYAIWDSRWKLVAHGVLTSSSSPMWELKAYDLMQQFQEVVEEHNCVEGYIEMPALFGSVGGLVTANSGALVKLAWFVGMVCGGLKSNCPLKPIGVNLWKGQLPKEIVILRIKRILPRCAATTHDWDAIGIGLYLKGDLK
jgi:hypothetical protein